MVRTPKTGALIRKRGTLDLALYNRILVVMPPEEGPPSLLSD